MKRKTIYALIALGALLAIGSVAVTESEGQSVERHQAGQRDMKMAEATCQHAIEAAAKDPSSIQYDREVNDFVYGPKDNKNQALSTVVYRAKNSFGAVVRESGSCVLKRSASGQAWDVIDLQTRPF
jgi:PBP1b-binding outer membrane lipoprotein LpoB